MAKGKKTGGRGLGSGNKPKAFSREEVITFIADYTNSKMFSEDFVALTPKERVTFIKDLLPYAITKMTEEAQSKEENTQSLARKLADLAGLD